MSMVHSLSLIKPLPLVEPNRDPTLPHPREREQRARFRVYFFGLFRLLYNNQALEQPVWRRNKAKSLLKWFLLHPGALCSADQLVTLFWPDISPETAYSNLHVTIHYLRRLLEPSLAPGQRSSFVHRHVNNFYQFMLDETWWVDVLEVQELVETGRELDQNGDFSGAAFYYRKVVGYCEKGFLPEDIYEDPFQQDRRHYECLFLQILLRLIEISQQHNVLHEVLDYAYQALYIDPYYEPAVKAIAHVYMEQGNTSVAMRTIDEFQRFLDDEMGIEPGKDILALRDQITSNLR